MATQIPNGDPNLYCPFWKKTCDRVCKTCPLFKQVRGRDVNTGKEVDTWDCSLSWLPTLLIEVAQQSRSGAAATEGFRNEMLQLNMLQLNHEMAKEKPVTLPASDRRLLK